MTTNNKQRKLLYDQDVSSTYPIMDKFCVITVIPKSEIVAGRYSDGVTKENSVLDVNSNDNNSFFIVCFSSELIYFVLMQ
jgi:hypothetical protein